MSFTKRYNGRHQVILLNLLTTSGLSILLHGIILLPVAMSCDNIIYRQASSNLKHLTIRSDTQSSPFITLCLGSPGMDCVYK